MNQPSQPSRGFDETLLSAYIDNELAPSERAEVEKQLEDDPDLRLLLDDLRQVQSTLNAWSKSTPSKSSHDSASLPSKPALDTSDILKPFDGRQPWNQGIPPESNIIQAISGSVSVDPSSNPSTSPKAASRMRWLAMAAGLGALAIGMALVWITRTPSGDLAQTNFAPTESLRNQPREQARAIDPMDAMNAADMIVPMEAFAAPPPLREQVRITIQSRESNAGLESNLQAVAPPGSSALAAELARSKVQQDYPSPSARSFSSPAQPSRSEALDRVEASSLAELTFESSPDSTIELEMDAHVDRLGEWKSVIDSALEQLQLGQSPVVVPMKRRELEAFLSVLSVQDLDWQVNSTSAHSASPFAGDGGFLEEKIEVVLERADSN